MSLWHGMLRASSWARWVVWGRGKGAWRTVPSPSFLHTCHPANSQNVLLTALTHSIALTAECPSAKHSDWLLILVLSLLQWALVTFQFHSPVPSHDLITLPLKQVRVATGFDNWGELGEGKRWGQTVEFMVLALEIEMGHCAIFLNERDDEALSQPTFFMKIFALILSLKISSELVGCLVGDFRGALSRPVLKTVLRLKQKFRSHLGFISKQMLAPSSLPLDQTPSRMGLERREGIEVEKADLPALPPLALLHCCSAGELVWMWHL